MKRIKRFIKLALLVTAFCSISAKGQILVDTVSVVHQGELSIGPSLSFSEIQYKDKDDNTGKIERNTLGLSLVYKLNPDVSLLLQAGDTYKATYKGRGTYNNRVDGNMFGGGLNFVMYKYDNVAFIGYGLINYVTDSFDKPTFDVNLTDIHVGAITAVKGTDTVTFYGAVDLVPYSKGTLKYDRFNVDVQRDEMVNLKLGLDFTLPGVDIKPEVTLLGEKAVTLTASFVM